MRYYIGAVVCASITAAILAFMFLPDYIEFGGFRVFTLPVCLFLLCALYAAVPRSADKSGSHTALRVIALIASIIWALSI